MEWTMVHMISLRSRKPSSLPKKIAFLLKISKIYTNGLRLFLNSSVFFVEKIPSSVCLKYQSLSINESKFNLWNYDYALCLKAFKGRITNDTKKWARALCVVL